MGKEERADAGRKGGATMGDMMSAACGNADRADEKTSSRSGSKVFTQPEDVKHLHACLTSLEVIPEVRELN